MTPELLELIKKHIELFGYDPRSEIELEYANDYKGFMADVRSCIDEGVSISDKFLPDEDL